MTPHIAPPPPELLAEILGTHAHRYPEKASIDVIGDGGVPLRLPLILGNPTGCAPSPIGTPSFPAWENLVALTLGSVKRPGVTAEVVRDCLIYPSRGQLAEWEERWPALVDNLGDIVLEKFGASAKAIQLPIPGEEPPASTRPTLDATPAACWRWIAIGGARVAVVIVPPSKPHWDAFVSAVGREGTDLIALITELVATCCKGDGIGVLLQRWPGLMLPLENAVVKMAGAAAQARLGEW